MMMAIIMKIDGSINPILVSRGVSYLAAIININNIS